MRTLLHILPDLVFGSALSFVLDLAGRLKPINHIIMVTDSVLNADPDIDTNIRLTGVDVMYSGSRTRDLDDIEMSYINPEVIIAYDAPPHVLNFDRRRYPLLYIMINNTRDESRLACPTTYLVPTEEARTSKEDVVFRPYVDKNRISAHYGKRHSGKKFIGISAGNRYKFPYKLVSEVIEGLDPEVYEVGVTDMRKWGPDYFSKTIDAGISTGKIPAMFKYSATTPAELYSRADIVVDLGGYRTRVEAGIFHIPVTLKPLNAKGVIDDIHKLTTDSVYYERRVSQNREFCGSQLLDVNLTGYRTH